MQAAVAAHVTGEQPAPGSVLAQILSKHNPTQEALMRVLAKPGCPFADFPLLMRLEGAVMKYRSRPEWLKAFLMVRGRCTLDDMHTKKGRQATWNLIQCGLDSTCMESLTATVHLCIQGLKDTPVFYWPFVQRVLSKNFVDKHLRKGGVAMATAVLRLASKALVCRASMELPGTAATSLQDTIVHVICAGVTYHMADAEEFLSEVVHVSALFTGWCSVLRRCLLRKKWRELTVPGMEQALCVFIGAGGPRILVDGTLHQDCKPKYRGWCDVRDAVVQAWSRVLAVSPWCVTLAWIQGCCLKRATWLGELVLLNAVRDNAARWNPNQIQQCLNAVCTSFYRRLRVDSEDVTQHRDTTTWAGTACAAVSTCWVKEAAYMHAACHVLALAVFMEKDALAKRPELFGVVQEALHHAMHNRHVCYGFLLCARNVLVSAKEVRAEDQEVVVGDLRKTIFAWVCAMEKENFVQVLALHRKDAVEHLCWILQQLSPSPALAVRCVWALVQHLDVTENDTQLAVAFDDMLLSAQTIPAEDVFTVLQILVHLRVPWTKTWQTGRRYRLPGMLANMYGSSRGDTRAMFVHPHDDAWNLKLFQFVGFFSGIKAKAWLVDLSRSLCSGHDPLLHFFRFSSLSTILFCQLHCVTERLSPCRTAWIAACCL